MAKLHRISNIIYREKLATKSMENNKCQDLTTGRRAEQQGEVGQPSYQTPAERSHLLREMKIPFSIPIPDRDEISPSPSPSPPPPSWRDRDIPATSRTTKMEEDSLEDWRGDFGSHLKEEAPDAREPVAARCLPPPPLLRCCCAALPAIWGLLFVAAGTAEGGKQAVLFSFFGTKG
jgi:hypothetical protein